MTLSVSFQSAALYEGLATAVTNMRALTTVDLIVAPKRTWPGEVFATDQAVVRFEACVAPHVRLHVLESLSADTTGPTSLSV